MLDHLASWDKSYLTMLYKPFNVLFSQFSQYFVQDIYSYVIRDIGLLFSCSGLFWHCC